MKRITVLILSLVLLGTLCAVGVSAATGSASNDGMSVPMICFVAGVIGLAAGGITVALMVRAMSTVRAQKRADHYADHDSFHLDDCRDIFLFSRVTKVQINTNKK